MKKRGISPVIATVLLIAMVVVLGLIIFLWFRGFTQEAITKFDTNVELVCNDVSFDASYSPSTKTLSIVNTGNIPIYQMSLKESKEDSYSTEEITHTKYDAWPETGLNQGGAFSDVINLPGIKEITLTPILIGSSRTGQKSFTCNEAQTGRSIIIANV